MTAEQIERYTEIVNEQQQKLRFSQFGYSDAFALGILVVETARNKYKSVSVRVDIDGTTVFYNLMDGTNLGNDWWMKKKLNGCLKTGESSFMNFLTIGASGRRDEFPWSEDEGNFAIVGGCFPIRLTGGEIKGYLMVSGLPHQEDHQLMIDALSAYLGAEVPTVLDGTEFK